MSSCSYLDPASLLAQSAVSIRLGRRASNCSHTLLATARRAPLNESNVQGSLKQPSTAASAPTKVLQSVEVDHIRRRKADGDDTAVGHLRPAHSRRRSVEDGALQIAVAGSSECAVEELIPSLELDVAFQQPLADVMCPSEAGGVRTQRSAAPQTPNLEAARAATYQLGPHSTASGSGSTREPDRTRQEPQPLHGHQRPQNEHQQQQQLLAESHPHMQFPHASVQSRHPQGGRGRGDLPAVTGMAGAAAAGAVSVAVLGRTDVEAHADRISHLSHVGGSLAPEGVTQGGSSDTSFSSVSGAAPAVARSSGCTADTPDLPSTSLRPPLGILPPPEGGGEPPDVGHSGPVGGHWGGGLESELLACRTIHSVQRFLQLMGPRASAELMGNAVVHLSHLVAEEPPDSALERQLLAGLLDDLTRRLRGSGGQMGRGLLAALVCAMSRLRCFDGPLLRELATAAREAAAELTTRQIGGLMWAFGRYHRDFAFRLAPGWSAALLSAALPALPRAHSTEVAMMLYGCALLREPPSSAVLAALLTASLAGMPSACGPELAMSIWSLAALRLHPGRDWLRAFLDRCDEATRTFAAGAAVSNVLYGLAAMRVQPPAAWMVNFLWQAQRRMSDMDAQSLVMLGWALGRMRYRPDRKWLTRFFRYTRSAVLLQPRDPVFPGVSTQGLAREPPSHEALQAATQRQVALWRRQQQRLQQRLQQQRAGPWGSAVAADGSVGLGPIRTASGGAAMGGGNGAIPAQAYNILLWSCVRLSCRPMGRWLPLLCAAVQPRLAAWPPHELSALLWGLARLSCRPRDDWMTEFCAAARSSLHLFQPPDCVMTLLAMSRLCSGLGYRATDGELANALAARLAPFYPRLQTTTLISVLLAMSRVTPRVRPMRLQEALTALLDRVQAVGMAPDALAPPVVVEPEAGAEAAEVARQQLQPRDAGLQGSILVAQTPPPSPDLTRPQSPQFSRSTPAGAAAAALPPLTSRECANAVFAVGCVALWPSYSDVLRGLCAALLRELMPRAFRLMPQMNGVDLVLLLHGVAMSRFRVGALWLRRHEEQAVRRLRAGELRPTQLRDLHRAYHALDYQPELLAASVAAGPGYGEGTVGDGVAGPGYGEAPVGDGGREGDVGGGVAGGDGEPDGQEQQYSARTGADGHPQLHTAGSSAPGGEAVRLPEGGQATQLSEAAKARRRRAAQGRRRRVTAAIERRVMAAKQQAAAAANAEVEQQPAHGANPGTGSDTSVEGTSGQGALDELEAAERELEQRRALIRRYTAAGKRRGAATGAGQPEASEAKPSRKSPEQPSVPKRRRGVRAARGADADVGAADGPGAVFSEVASRQAESVVGGILGCSSPAVVAGV